MKETIESLQGEIWKPAVSLEDVFLISNFGRVYRKRKLTKMPKGDSYRVDGGKIIPQSTLRHGYKAVSYTTEDGKHKSVKVHRLVAMTFVSGYKEGLMVNHKDENTSNNNASNLEWCDSKYNNTYGSRIEKFTATFKARNRCCIPVVEHSKDGTIIATYKSMAEAAKAKNVSSTSICNAVNKGTISCGSYWSQKQN